MRILVPILSLLLFFPIDGKSNLVEIPEVMKSQFPAPDFEAKSWVLADFETGWVLASKNPDMRIEPASLTKLMTSFLVFEALKKQEISMDDLVYVSKKAWKTGGSKMFIQVDTRVKVIDLVQGLIVQSGNDAAVALAEHIGGTEAGFATRMNHKAAELGMINTQFSNSSGLPEENHYSSARDMTLLSITLIRGFPELYKYYSQPEFTYNNITQGNRNTLLSRDPEIDGIKTGYTKNAGYCLIGTAKRENVRRVATVTGSKSRTTRANQVQSLLQYSYSTYDGMVVYAPGTEIKAVPLWMGEASTASVGVNKNLGVLYPKGEADKLSAALELPDSLEAPLESGQQVGHIQIKYDGNPVYRATLHVNENYPEGTLIDQVLDSIKRLIF